MYMSSPKAYISAKIVRTSIRSAPPVLRLLHAKISTVPGNVRSARVVRCNWQNVGARDRGRLAPICRVLRWRAEVYEPLSIAEIKDAVCREFGVRPIDMESHRRARMVARPRQVAMYLVGELTRHSLPVIGRHFGGRDHTTVMYAMRKIRMLAEVDPDFGQRVARLREQLTTE